MSEDRKEQLVIKGSTLKGIVRRRITVLPKDTAYDRAIGLQETIIKQIVNNNIVNPIDPNRKTPQVTIAEDKKRGIWDRWRTRYENLADKIIEIAEYSELGWDVILDVEKNKWIFDVIEGRKLTADQEELPPVIFSVDFDNIKNKHFLKNLLNYKNVAYAGGKGEEEEEERFIQQIGESTGLDRREVFLDCSQADDIVRT